MKKSLHSVLLSHFKLRLQVPEIKRIDADHQADADFSADHHCPEELDEELVLKRHKKIHISYCDKLMGGKGLKKLE